MESNKAEGWISEAAEVEALYDTTHKRGTFLLAYQLGLSSVHPLQKDHVIRALNHLRRKCPSLRICFGRRNGVTWLRHSVNENIDFQVVSGISPDEMRDLLQTYQYNSETGPLWCARLLLETKDDTHVMDEGFPHTSQLFLGLHHSIADGITILKICGAFTSLLNDVIAGKSIDDLEQIGQFSSDLEMERLVSSKMAVIQKDPALMQELTLAAKDKGIGMPLLSSVIPSSEEGEDRTHNLTSILDKAITKQFIAKCKTEGVTVNSALTALANASMVTFFVDNQYTRDSYRLCNGHVINLRRYWPGDSSQILGCHAHFPLNLWTEVPKDVVQNFWDFVRYLHQDIHHHLREESVLFREAYMKLNTKKQEPSCDDILFSSVPMQVDGSFSNLGNVTGYVTEGGPHVKPYLLIRQISLHRTNIKNFAHFFHTLRGRLIMSLLYNTKFVSKDTAQKHRNQILSIMKEVTKSDI